MAQPISKIVKIEQTPKQQKEQTLDQLLNTLIENAEGLKQATKLIQELQESGILPALQALVSAKEQVASIAVQQLLRPEVTNMVNNAMAAAGALGSLQPETTEKLVASVSNGLKQAEAGIVNNQTTRVWDLMKAVKDPDINRALTFGLNFLKGLGNGLK